MANTNIQIRMAVPTDAGALLQIYAPYVEKTAITFEYSVPTIDDFSNRISTILEKYPYLVALDEGEVVGYAYASAFKSRAAYDWSVEVSIYLKHGHLHKGLGSKLYAALESILTAQNICNVCACITFPGEGSIQFHEALGYKTVAHFTASGYKFNKWHDMVWMEKFLCPHALPPASFIPISQLELNPFFS